LECPINFKIPPREMGRRGEMNWESTKKIKSRMKRENSGGD
jgi:hypothetical protein